MNAVTGFPLNFKIFPCGDGVEVRERGDSRMSARGAISERTICRMDTGTLHPLPAACDHQIDVLSTMLRVISRHLMRKVHRSITFFHRAYFSEREMRTRR